MEIRVGDTVVMGGSPTRKKKRNFRDSVKEYDQKAHIALKDLTIVSYDLRKESVTLVTEEGEKIEQHISIMPLGVGYYGINSYMHPTNLKFSHPGFITDLSENNICIHRITNKRCRLVIDKDFNMTGDYSLVALENNEKVTKTYRSEVWDRQGLIAYLDSLKGYNVVGRGKVAFIIKDGVCHNSIILSNKLDLIIVVSFDDGTVASFPLKFFQWT